MWLDLLLTYTKYYRYRIKAFTQTGTEGATSTPTADSIKPNKAGTNDIVANAITADLLAANSVYTNALQAGCVVTSKLEAGEIILATVAKDFNWSTLGDDGNKPADNADVTPNLPSDENLTGYWAFNEGKGIKAHDSSGKENHGTLQNMEEDDWVKGISGKCLDFDGVNEYVDLTSQPIPNDSAEYSYSVWFRCDGGEGTRRFILE